MAASAIAPISRWASGRTGRGAQHAAVHGVLEGEADQPEAVALVDLAPLLPAQHGRGVEQGDAHDGRVGAGVEEGAHAGHHQLPRVVDAADAGADVGDQRLLELLVDGAEEVALVGEVVVERAAGDAGPGHDLLGADARVAALGEQLAAGAQQRVAGASSPETYSLYATRIQPVWKEPA